MRVAEPVSVNKVSKEIVSVDNTNREDGFVETALSSQDEKPSKIAVANRKKRELTNLRVFTMRLIHSFSIQIYTNRLFYGNNLVNL